MLFPFLIKGQATVVGAETRINTTTINQQQNPATAMALDGSFVVVWESMDQDGDGYGIYYQYYTSGGNASGGENQASSTSTGHQRLPSVDMDGTGNWVATWDSNFDIYARQFNGTSASAAEFLVNTNSSEMQSYPDVALDHDGDFIIVWQSLDQDGDDYGIYGQLYDNSASTVNSEFAVNSTTSNNQLSPAVAMDSLGNFAVVWVSNAQDGDAEGIFMQHYDNTGAANAAGEMQVNSSNSGAQDNPDIGMTEDGEILVVWNSYSQDGSRFGVYQQAFYYDLATSSVFYSMSSAETQVNTTTSDFQQFPAIAMRNDEDAVVVWQEGTRAGTSSQDGDDYGVYMQRYIIPGGATLPIELLNFEATRINPDEVQLNWETQTEINNKGFYLERMFENESMFEPIAWIDGKGNSTFIEEYAYLDDNAFTGLTYYRLQQVDFDGTTTYSEIRVVTGEENQSDLIGDLNLYPNPVQDFLNVKFQDLGEHLGMTIRIKILNSSGQIVYSDKQNISAYEVLEIYHLDHLPSGMYILQIQLPDQSMYREKFIKID